MKQNIGLRVDMAKFVCWALYAYGLAGQKSFSPGVIPCQLYHTKLETKPVCTQKSDITKTQCLEATPTCSVALTGKALKRLANSCQKVRICLQLGIIGAAFCRQS